MIYRIELKSSCSSVKRFYTHQMEKHVQLTYRGHAGVLSDG